MRTGFFGFLFFLMVSMFLFSFSKNSQLAEISSIVQTEVNLVDSSDYYKNKALIELKNYENMSGALRIFSKLFGDNL